MSTHRNPNIQNIGDHTIQQKKTTSTNIIYIYIYMSKLKRIQYKIKRNVQKNTFKLVLRELLGFVCFINL